MIRKGLKIRDYQRHHLDTSKSECAGCTGEKIHSQTNKYKGRCPGKRFALRQTSIPQPRLSLKVCRCAGCTGEKIHSQTNKYKGRPGVQAKDLLSDKQIQGQARCPGKRFTLRQTNTSTPRLSRRNTLIQTEHASIFFPDTPRLSQPVTHSAA